MSDGLKCPKCPRGNFKTPDDLANHDRAKHPAKGRRRRSFLGPCPVCGGVESGIVPETGICGVCTFGTADAIGEFYA